MNVLNGIFSVLRLFPVSRFEIITSSYSNYILTLASGIMMIGSVLVVSHYVADGSIADILGVDSASEISIIMPRSIHNPRLSLRMEGQVSCL
jgi:hypothetical protein